MPVFVAQVEFRFDADSVEAGGKRLRELADAARSVGFDLRTGRVEPAPPGSENDSGATVVRYGPEG